MHQHLLYSPACLSVPGILSSFFFFKYCLSSKKRCGSCKIWDQIAAWYFELISERQRSSFEHFRAKRSNISFLLSAWVFWGKATVYKTSHWWLGYEPKKTEFWTVWFLKEIVSPDQPNNYTFCISSSDKLQWSSSWFSKKRGIGNRKGILSHRLHSMQGLYKCAILLLVDLCYANTKTSDSLQMFPWTFLYRITDIRRHQTYQVLQKLFWSPLIEYLLLCFTCHAKIQNQWSHSNGT